MRRSLVLVACAAVAFAVADATSEVELVSVGFGSCNKHDRSQAYWKVLGDVTARNVTGADGQVTTKPSDGFVWLGDVVYNDYSPVPFVWLPSTLEAMSGKLEAQKKEPHYARFLKDGVAHGPDGTPQVAGVWDDHDMGKNDGGREFALKDETQRLFLDFLDVPADSPKRKRQGVYSLHGFPIDAAVASEAKLNAASRALLEGKDFAVCALLLDGRYGRDALGSDGDMLGPEQWAWLDRVLADPSPELGPAPGDGKKRRSLSDRCLVTLIGSGVQVLADEKPTEHWGHFPTSRYRLLSLLYKNRMERFIFVSGDVHYAELASETQSPFGFPLVDVTSSGLTHTVGSILPPFLFDMFCVSPRRLGRLLDLNFGRVSVSVATNGALELSATVHVLPSGAKSLEYSVPLTALTFSPKGDSETRCGQACRLAVHEGRLKKLIDGFKRIIGPSRPVHVQLVTFLLVVIATGAVAVALGLRLISKLLRRREKRKAVPKRD